MTNTNGHEPRRQCMAPLPPEMDAAIERCADAMQAVLRVWGDDKPMREAPADLPELIAWQEARAALEDAAKRSGRTKDTYDKLPRRSFKEYPRWRENALRALRRKREQKRVERERKKAQAAAAYKPKVPRKDWALRAENVGRERNSGISACAATQHGA